MDLTDPIATALSQICWPRVQRAAQTGRILVPTPVSHPVAALPSRSPRSRSLLVWSSALVAHWFWLHWRHACFGVEGTASIISWRKETISPEPVALSTPRSLPRLMAHHAPRLVSSHSCLKQVLSVLAPLGVCLLADVSFKRETLWKLAPICPRPQLTEETAKSLSPAKLAALHDSQLAHPPPFPPRTQNLRAPYVVAHLSQP